MATTPPPGLPGRVPSAVSRSRSPGLPLSPLHHSGHRSATPGYKRARANEFTLRGAGPKRWAESRSRHTPNTFDAPSAGLYCCRPDNHTSAEGRTREETA